MLQRRLIVMRHAKSAWPQGISDHERPLNKRGRAAAPLVAAELQSRDWTPEVVVSSDAQRTVETWERMKDHFSPTPQVIFDQSLYLSGYSEVVSAAIQLPDSCATALFLGHNPGWEMLASQLAGETIDMATGVAVLFQTAAESWKGAFSGREWELVGIIRPRELEKESERH
ncbi:histidine phosphatase family protein [Blastopirellula sp. JC732]|uniref:Histidine phosphatase family protein n=1 Tax=Blastopirellula sediminis TaxID=2894196 RepID=A0A9X1MJC6_9BACT|nr:histidine phosphatase family protein [Blastopirellula sediminis]MCC9607800.1 histidine phosphatase family protein [Blastopirellula sediminis]MCC9627407.1 histidine phosphatase family protein [Blastopirellula sediminis]